MARPNEWRRIVFKPDGSLAYSELREEWQRMLVNVPISQRSGGVTYLSLPASLEPPQHMIEIPIWPDDPER